MDILTIITFIKLLTYYAFVASYKTGQLIVTTTKYLVLNASDMYCGIATVLKILYEDFLLFIWDIGGSLYLITSYCINYMENTFICIQAFNNIVKYVVTNIYGTISSTCASLLMLINNIVCLLGHIGYYLKYLTILTCSGIWFALTIIPLTIMYMNVLSVHYIWYLYDEIFNFLTSLVSKSIHSLYNLSTLYKEISCEAILGLLFTFSMVYLFYQYNMNAYVYFKRVIINLCTLIWTHSVVQFNETKKQYIEMKQQYKVERDKRHVASKRVPKTDDETSNCCVCQERPKCVLILPCRHLCICSECNTQLGRIRAKTCPICRTTVNTTMKVYT